MKTNNNEYQSFLATSNRKYFKVGLAGAFLFCIGIFQLPLYSKTVEAYLPITEPESDKVFTITYVPETIEKKIELPKETTAPQRVIASITNIVTTPERIIEPIESPTPLVVPENTIVKVVAPIDPPTPASSTPLDVAQVMPKFGSSEADIYSYITKNIRYEKALLDFEGKVYVRFVVNKDGNVTDVEVVKGAHPLLDKEAMRVIKNMPAWIPGSQNGESVNVRMVVPINFVTNG